jgi:hypothetical protein
MENLQYSKFAVRLLGETYLLFMNMQRTHNADNADYSPVTVILLEKFLQL